MGGLNQNTFFKPLRVLLFCEDELVRDAVELSRDDEAYGEDPLERIKERMSEWVSRGDWAAP